MTMGINRPDRILGGLLAASLCLNWYFLVRLRAINGRGGRQPLEEGTLVTPFKVRGSGGQAGEIRFDNGQPTVLYAFSTKCGWCIRNTPSVRALAAQSAKEYRFVGLALNREGLVALDEEAKLGFPVFTDPTGTVVGTLRLTSTPTTIVISPGGVVLKTWHGAYNGAVAQEVSRFFKVPLPGLVDDSPS